jgi:SynChlorMet cassette protein ScmC
MNIIKPLFKHERVYSLRLANGQRWGIIATKGARRWVEKLASIMELKRCEPNGYPKLIFIKRESGRESLGEPISGSDLGIREDLPRHGWKTRDFHALQLWSHDDMRDMICEIRHPEGHEQDILRMWITLYPVYRQAQDSGSLPFHAALVERNGSGILLAGRGGAGKSTCCRRLPPPWHALCDDHTLIVRDDSDQYRAHPLPTWSDYLMRRSEPTWNVQRHLPLSAIFFLLRAEIDEVVPIGRGRTAGLMTQSAIQVYNPNFIRHLGREEVRALKKELFENACELTRSIPAFILCVSPSGQFWKQMEKVLP